MTMTTCIQCGELSDRAYCPEHRPAEAPKTKTTTERGYGWSWQKLSQRARRIQNFCSDCGSTEDLQLDHTPETWERWYDRKGIRLEHTGGVVCGDCNIARGQARPGEKGTDHPSPAPHSKAFSQLLSASTDSKEEE